MIRDHLQENENVKPNTAFIEELRSNFSEFFNKNGDFNLDEFKNALKENNIKEFSDGYQLNFIGKDYARKQAGNAPTSVIVPDNEHNQKEENKNSKNLFFTGDNLEVLRHLRNNYSNKIDVIYIDPPYNTGNDDFVYPDKFEYSDKQLEEVFGMTKDDVSKLDALKGSKSHSAWLTFMYPRLWLAKQLLTEDGVIFVSIDDNEQANLKLLMDEIYGESNFITDFIWEKTQHFGRQKINYYGNVDHVLSYKRGTGDNKEILVEYQKKDFIDAPLFNRSNNARTITFPPASIKFLIKDGKYSETTNSNFVLTEPICVRNSYNITPVKLRFRSRWSQRKVNEELRNGTTFIVKSQDFSIRAIYGENKISNESPKQIIFTNDKNPFVAENRFDKKVGTNENASSYTNKLLGGNFFSYPKPVSLVEYLISLVMKNGIYSNDITVLDFFAGSATTADAVMQLNAEDGGNRKFIMVQLPEKTYVEENKKEIPTKGGKAAFKAGYKSIDEISRERIKRAAKKIKEENPDLEENFDGGFKHYWVVSPEKETLDKINEFDPERYELVPEMVEIFSSSALLDISGNASGEDTILTTWLVEDGYDFNTDDLVKYDFAGYKAYGIKDARLYLIDNNFGSKQIKDLLNKLGTNKVKFQSVVVYGYSFDTMSMKELELGLLQLNSEVKLIKRY